MTTEDKVLEILNGHTGQGKPVKVTDNGYTITKLYGPADGFKVERYVKFAGREIPLPSLAEMLPREESVREPTVTTYPMDRQRAASSPDSTKEDITHD